MLRAVPSLQAPPRFHGYSSVSTVFAGAKSILPDMSEKEVLNTEWKLNKLVKFDGPGTSSIEITSGGHKRRVNAYCKVTHILDPIRSMQGYYEEKEKGERRKEEKINNPNNQSYVDAIACAALSKVREAGLSPHFCLTYGVYRAVADVYRWNITSDFNSYRKYRNFWEKRRAGHFTLYIEKDDDSEISVTSTVERLRGTPDSDMHSRAFSYRTAVSKSGSQASHESMEDLQVSPQMQNSSVELVELESLGLQTEGSIELVQKDPELEEVQWDEESNSSSGVEIYSEMKKFPVMIIFQEHLEGTLDDLLLDDAYSEDDSNESDETEEEEEEDSESGGEEEQDSESGGEEEEDEEKEKEKRWTAWTFQIVAAVCQLNGLAKMIHNDLHTNNIVYAETAEKYLYYKSNDGRIWKVPTYGILFRIIDFGRSIYTLEGREFISDDFATGGDAEGQYNYGQIFTDRRGPEIKPNPSFDLCRFALSVIEVLYSEVPKDREGGRILNREPEGWEQKETVSDLFNMLWSWIVCDNGANVLRNKDGSERFPNFELYSEIAAHVHGAVAADQLGQVVFEPFRMEQKELSGNETVYKLFV